MSLARKDCEHTRLMFGSGDYYLFCQDCGAAWVMRRLDNDTPAPELANQGKGGGLSGQWRVRNDRDVL